MPAEVGPDKPQPFLWRDIRFVWSDHRVAYIGHVVVTGRDLWFLLKEDSRSPSFHQSWVEWEGGFTCSCTMTERELALESARAELLDSSQRQHEQLLKRFLP